MEKMCALTLILLSLSGVYSDSHSLHFRCTVVSAPGSGLPEFSIVGYVDDQQILMYNSDIRRTVPVAPWMKEHEVPEYWETQAMKIAETIFKHEVKTLTKRLNHTTGFHFAQVMYGCELRDGGNTVGYQQFGYDGKEYMYLDSQSATYIPTMDEAQIYTQEWNSPDARQGEMAKNILENECFDTLKKLLERGRAGLERRVRPGVKVTGGESGEITRLHCLVYGFYPRAVDVRWMKNEVDEAPSYETTDVLPNPDGTYQIRVTMEIISKEDDSYFCYVDHSSLGAPLLVKWEPNQDSPQAVIIGAAVIVLLLISITAGVLIYRNKEKRKLKNVQ